MNIEKRKKTFYNRLMDEIKVRLGRYVSMGRNCIIEEVDQNFFPELRLFSVTDFDVIPTSTLLLFDNGSQIYLLDGESQWENLIRNEKLNLDIKNVISYLKLYYLTANFPLRSQKIVESIEDIDFMRFPDWDVFEMVSRNIQPPIITYRNNQFTIFCNFTENDRLFHAAFDISDQGHITLVDKKMVLENLPIGEMLVDL